MNQCTFIGRLTADPDLKFTRDGKGIAKFTLAISDRFDREKTTFVDIVAFGKLAELCAEYLNKGKLAAISGRLDIQSYEDKNGVKRKFTSIIADEVEFLSPKGGEGK